MDSLHNIFIKFLLLDEPRTEPDKILQADGTGNMDLKILIKLDDLSQEDSHLDKLILSFRRLGRTLAQDNISKLEHRRDQINIETLQIFFLVALDNIQVSFKAIVDEVRDDGILVVLVIGQDYLLVGFGI